MPNVIIVDNTTELEIDSTDGQTIDRIDADTGEQTLAVARLGGRGSKVRLEPGIYRILSNSTVSVRGVNTDFQVASVTKDGWPDPPKKITEAKIGVNALIEFVAGRSIEKP